MTPFNTLTQAMFAACVSNSSGVEAALGSLCQRWSWWPVEASPFLRTPFRKSFSQTKGRTKPLWVSALTTTRRLAASTTRAMSPSPHCLPRSRALEVGFRGSTGLTSTILSKLLIARTPACMPMYLHVPHPRTMEPHTLAGRIPSSMHNRAHRANA